MKQEQPDPYKWMTDERITHALKLLMVVVLVLYLGQFILGFLTRIRAVMYILIGAIFFAYLIYPAVQLLSRRMPRILAILVVYAVILGGLAIAGIFLIPRLLDEIGQLVQQYPDAVARVNSMVNDPSDPVMARLPEWMRAEAVRVPAEIIAWVRVHGIETASHALVMLMGTFAAVATFVIIPLITAYLLLDLDHLKGILSAMLPQSRRKAAFELLHDVDGVIGGFIRGQLLVALAVGVLITIALLVLHVRYAFLLGLLAAIGDLIPYVGAIIAFVPAIGTALFTNGWVNALIVFAVFLTIFELEGHVIAPNIVSKQVSLSPFVVLLALLVGGDLGGLIGMLVAVPVAGVIRVLALRVLGRRSTNEGAP